MGKQFHCSDVEVSSCSSCCASLVLTATWVLVCVCVCGVVQWRGVCSDTYVHIDNIEEHIKSAVARFRRPNTDEGLRAAAKLPLSFFQGLCEAIDDADVLPAVAIEIVDDVRKRYSEFVMMLELHSRCVCVCVWCACCACCAVKLCSLCECSAVCVVMLPRRADCEHAVSVALRLVVCAVCARVQAWGS